MSLPAARLLVLPALLLCSVSAARAQKPATAADALAREGIQLAKADDYQGAIAKFKAAERLAPRALHVCNIGRAYGILERFAQAHMYLSMCLDRTPKGFQPPAWVRDALAQYERTLNTPAYGRIKVTTTPSDATITVSAFANDDAFTSPRTLWVPAGKLTVRAQLSGHTPAATTVTVSGGQSAPQQVTIELAKSSDVGRTRSATDQPAHGQASRAPGTQPATPSAPDAALTPAPANSARHVAQPGRGPWPWLALSVGVAATGTGIYFHSRTLTELACLDTDDSVLYDKCLPDYQRFRNLTIGSYALGALALGGATYLWLRTPGRSSRSQADLQLGMTPLPGGAAVFASWSQ